MPRISFRFRLILSYAVLVLAVLAVTDVQLNSGLSADLRERLDNRLETSARDALVWITEGIDPARVAEHTARSAEARVTVIGPDGVVVADSERTGEALAKMENHNSRPEVIDAHRVNVGRATRLSDTVHKDMRYVAVSRADGTVVRLAVPLDEIAATISAMRARLFGASVIAFAVALALGFLIARASVRPLVEMTDAANRLARGHFGGAVADPVQDEFGTLSRALTSLASQLEARIGDLTEEKDRLSAMLGGMVEGVLVVNDDGRVVIANRSAEEILETNGLVGRTVTEAIRHPTARELIGVTLAEGRAAECTFEDLGVRARSVALSVRPLGDGGAVAVLHDVTRLRKLETIRRDFVSNVSHELQTPVASIQSYAESLIDGALTEPETAKKFTEVIHRNAVRMGRLVKDLLQLSRIEARAPDEARRELVDVHEVVAHVVETVSAGAERDASKIEVDVPEDLRARGDADGVAQMVLNLADNALKYGRKGGTVRITAKREGEHAVIVVSDDGPGIEARHISRVFERFYRIDEGRSRERGGTGLGLAIVKHLAESMGGSAEVESEVGKGSTFRVKLPAA